MRALLASLLLLVACDDPDRSGSNGTGDDDDGDHATFELVSPSDESLALLELVDPEGNSEEVIVVSDQLLVALADGVTTAEIDTLVETVAGEQPDWGLQVIGRVAMTGLTQLAFDNLDRPASEQAARLQDAVARFESEAIVSAVSPNHLLEMSVLVEDYSDDNNILQHTERCAYSVVDYYQAYAVLDDILQHVPLTDVTVAVVDTEIARSTGEFDEIAPRLTEITAPQPVRPNFVGHGTAVAGIIAADDGDDGLNGVALPFLGSRLSMQFVFSDPYSYQQISEMLPGAEVSEAILLAPLGNVLAGIGQAVTRGADVVNLSLGSARPDGAPPAHIRAMRQMWWDTLTHADARNTLFVAAAPNHPIELTGFNSAPGGLTDPATEATPDNLLTVGGVSACDPMQRWSGGAHGDLVQAYAPAETVAVLQLSPGPWVGAVGNSYAAPFVTSIATLARSVAPNTSGAQLRDLLLADPASLPVSPDDTGDGGVRPTLMFTVGHAILQHAPDNASVNELLDNIGGAADDVPDSVGWVCNKHVFTGHLAVDGPEYDSAQDIPRSEVVVNGTSMLNHGWIDPATLSLNLSVGEVQMGLQVTTPLHLGQSYPIGGLASVELDAPAPDGVFKGAGTSGTLTLSECELTTRSLPLDHFGSPEAGPYEQLVFIQFEGEFEGSALGEIDSEPPQTDVTYEFSGRFNTAFSLIFPSASEMARWEQICEGGFTP